MNKPRVALTAGAVFLSAALAVTLFLSQQETSNQSSSDVYTWDCEYPEQRPEQITLTCADGGMSVNRIEWSRWDESGAEGKGFYNVNDCDPNCAEGTMLEMPVSARLRDLVAYKGKKYLSTLEINSFKGENLPQSGESSLVWDVMEFAEMMGVAGSDN
jgi:hypothetical protein